ncbi:hypothetical protein RMSM_05828 [Rhodopirellula maiorica SM1]|uniref:Uncharacterized protein n=1 Tax=Rhodopirellula maiorica SM1 TaxID=1265738 RepID=M5RDW1_9BACT|nr:hypothetical protein RMSM_05828 [Rhodopirellula maiorica SM1]
MAASANALQHFSALPFQSICILILGEDTSDRDASWQPELASPLRTARTTERRLSGTPATFVAR